MFRTFDLGPGLVKGVSDLTDNQTDASTVDQPYADRPPTDRPYADLPPPVNDLIVTVQAPAAALSRPDGQIRASGMDGLFVSDVRALTEVRLRFGGVEPHPLTVLPEGPGRTRFVSIAHGFGDPINDPTIRLDRVRQLTPDGMHEEIRIASVATRPVRAWVTIELRCDLTPLELARLGRSRPELPVQPRPAELRWESDGITVEASGAGAESMTRPDGLRWLVWLAPGERTVLTWRVVVGERRPVLAAPAGPVEWARPTVRGDDPRLARLLARSLDDLESLRLVEAGADPGRESTFVGAGAPWFLTLFGRDSIWAARMLLPLGTELAAGTLRALARRQGRAVDPAPARRRGRSCTSCAAMPPRARRRRPARGRRCYYGTRRRHPAWISLLPTPGAGACRPGGRAAAAAPRARRSAGSRRTATRTGTDSSSTSTTADAGWPTRAGRTRSTRSGSTTERLAPSPIALCEVQAYAHGRRCDAADLLDAFGRPGADRWRLVARRDWRTRFREPVLGRRTARPVSRPWPSTATGGRWTRSPATSGTCSAPGCCSAAEEAPGRRGCSAAPALAGGFGLRTMSTLDEGYKPLSYHCGSVWPHDTAIALLGLTAAGADTAAGPLIDGLLSAAEAFDYRLPELYGGRRAAPTWPARSRTRRLPPAGLGRGRSGRRPAGALGLAVDLPAGEVRLRPLAAAGALEATGLRIAGRSVSIAVDRDNTVRVTGLPGSLKVTTGPGAGPILEVAGGAADGWPT